MAISRLAQANPARFSLESGQSHGFQCTNPLHINWLTTTGTTTTTTTTTTATSRRRFCEVFAIFFENDAANLFSKNRSRRCDVFDQKIVKMETVLAIFRPFENFGRFVYKLVAESKGSIDPWIQGVAAPTVTVTPGFKGLWCILQSNCKGGDPLYPWGLQYRWIQLPS